MLRNLKLYIVSKISIFHELALSHFRSPTDLLRHSEKFFDNESQRMAQENHLQHNQNNYLYQIGYGPLYNNPVFFSGCYALDFGSGGGRNAINISQIANFREIHLVDISQSNLEKSKVNVDRYGKGKFDYFKTDGMHVKLANKYKFIFSTITLQHIPSRTIRNSLLKDLINLLDDDGVISIQLGFGLKYTSKLKLMSVAYKNNDFASKVTNGRRDVRINSVELILEDLKALGAKRVEWFITPSFDDKHPKWLWLYIYKSDDNFLKTIQY